MIEIEEMDRVKDQNVYNYISAVDLMGVIEKTKSVDEIQSIISNTERGVLEILLRLYVCRDKKSKGERVWLQKQ